VAATGYLLLEDGTSKLLLDPAGSGALQQETGAVTATGFCGAHPRGFKDTWFPWKPKLASDPCGKPILVTVNSVDVSAESLCLPHWTAKHGEQDLKAPLTFSS